MGSGKSKPKEELYKELETNTENLIKNTEIGMKKILEKSQCCDFSKKKTNSSKILFFML